MPQHPMFVKYTRDWLHKQTGFSKGYLSRVATGKVPLSRSFIERVCFKLNQPEEELFLPDSAKESTAIQPRDRQ
jgi:transcriptional regulator with XRE-family HTH domain